MMFVVERVGEVCERAVQDMCRIQMLCSHETHSSG